MNGLTLEDIFILEADAYRRWNRHYQIDNNIFGTRRVIDGMADPSEFNYKYGDSCLPEEDCKTNIIWALLQKHNDVTQDATIYLDDGCKIYIHNFLDNLILARYDFDPSGEWMPVLSCGLWRDGCPEQIIDYFKGGFHNHDNDYWREHGCTGGDGWKLLH